VLTVYFITVVFTCLWCVCVRARARVCGWVYVWVSTIIRKNPANALYILTPLHSQYALLHVSALKGASWGRTNVVCKQDVNIYRALVGFLHKIVSSVHGYWQDNEWTLWIPTYMYFGLYKKPSVGISLPKQTRKLQIKYFVLLLKRYCRVYW
jgi:hypothetical protein